MQAVAAGTGAAIFACGVCWHHGIIGGIWLLLEPAQRLPNPKNLENCVAQRHIFSCGHFRKQRL